MKYAFVGAGAMGAILASFFSASGQEVWLVDPFKEHMEAIAENGLTIKRGVNSLDGGKNYELNLKMNATTNADEVGKVDVVFLMVKYDYTESAIENIKKVSDENTTILTLQNGMGAVEILKEHFNPDQIAYGVTMITGRVQSPGVVENTLTPGVATHIGSENKALADKLTRVAEEFNASGECVTMQYNDDIDIYVWKKMCVNCGTSGWCAINRINTKIGFSRPEYVELQLRTIDECVAIANAKGVGLKADECYVTTAVLPLETGLFPHYPSTCQDIMNKRKSDVECLNGYIVREGKRLGVSTPLNDAIYLCMRILENTYDEQF